MIIEIAPPGLPRPIVMEDILMESSLMEHGVTEYSSREDSLPVVVNGDFHDFLMQLEGDGFRRQVQLTLVEASASHQLLEERVSGPPAKLAVARGMPPATTQLC